MNAPKSSALNAEESQITNSSKVDHVDWQERQLLMRHLFRKDLVVKANVLWWLEAESYPAEAMERAQLETESMMDREPFESEGQ